MKHYTLTALMEWLEDAPVAIRRKGEDDNPFVQYGREAGFKAPIDVEKRLKQMSHGGAGDASIHATQLAVSASMLNAGVDVEEVVDKLMEATRAAGDSQWNWAEEERNIRNMCATWEAKRTKREPAAQVVNLSKKRAERDQKILEGDGEKKSLKKSEYHVLLGRGILASLEGRGERILFTQGQLWHCRGGVWKAYSSAEEKSWLDCETQIGCDALKMTSTQRLVSETRAWVQRQPQLKFETVPWDAHGEIATRSGLIDPKTLTVSPLSPDDYVTHTIDCDYDSQARCLWWERMLADSFNNQPTIEALQEILGVALLDTKPRALMKGLVLVGPSNSGKSNILNVSAGLLSDEPNTTPFDTLENAHGLVPFLKHAPWLLHEAFDQSKWHFSATVKALLSGDAVSVNIKNGPLLSHRFRSAAFWGTNHPPQFKDASDAMGSRMIIILCLAKFDPRKLIGAAAEAVKEGYASPAEFVLDTEKSGILNWALQGMQRALTRGHITTTAEMDEQIHKMNMETNMVAEFVEECIAFDNKKMVSTTDFYGAFCVWWQENRDQSKIPPAIYVGRALSSLAHPQIGLSREELRRNNRRYYAGICLNELGLDLWKGYSNSRHFTRDTGIRISESGEKVNADIPPDWLGKGVIRKLRNA